MSTRTPTLTTLNNAPSFPRCVTRASSRPTMRTRTTQSSREKRRATTWTSTAGRSPTQPRSFMGLLMAVVQVEQDGFRLVGTVDDRLALPVGGSPGSWVVGGQVAPRPVGGLRRCGRIPRRCRRPRARWPVSGGVGVRALRVRRAVQLVRFPRLRSHWECMSCVRKYQLRRC